jgi:gamma-glutamyl-gamma-aminobutyrate hydrolase PuuD
MLKLLDVGDRFGNPVAAFLDIPYQHVDVEGMTIDDQLKAADLILFGGGADIHPSLYGHANVASHVGAGKSYRDVYEENIFVRNKRFHHKPMVGICRGAQFVCAMSGGSLIQDLGGHAIGRPHKIVTKDGQVLFVNSYHHQMMWPYDIDNKAAYDVLATTEVPLSKGYAYDVTALDSSLVGEREPEIVFFRETNALGIQCHPEWFSGDLKDSTGKYLNQLVVKQLNKEL